MPGREPGIQSKRDRRCRLAGSPASRPAMTAESVGRRFEYAYRGSRPAGLRQGRAGSAAQARRERRRASMSRRRKQGAKADPLKEAALAAKLPVYQPASYKDAEGLGGVQGAQARPAGDGVRHAVRAGGIPQHPDPRLDPVSPVAAAGLSRRVARSTGRSSRARRKPACRSSGPTTASIPATC